MTRMLDGTTRHRQPETLAVLARATDVAQHHKAAGAVL